MGMPPAYLASVYLHVVAACVWLGGMVFLVAVVLPTTREAPFRAHATGLIDRSGRRFRTVGWIALVTMLVTGIVNLGYRGFGWGDALGPLWQGPFGRALGWKLALFAGMVAAQALHDFWIGPRATAADAGHGWTRAARLLGRINFLVTLVIVWLAVALVRGGI